MSDLARKVVVIVYICGGKVRHSAYSVPDISDDGSREAGDSRGHATRDVLELAASYLALQASGMGRDV